MPKLSDIPKAAAAYIGTRKVWERIVNLSGKLKYSVISSSSTLEVLVPRSEFSKWETAVRGKRYHVMLNGRRSPGWVSSIQYQNDYAILRFSTGAVGLDGNKGDVARLVS